jgi:hypothetical protein
LASEIDGLASTRAGYEVARIVEMVQVGSDGTLIEMHVEDRRRGRWPEVYRAFTKSGGECCPCTTLDSPERRLAQSCSISTEG